MNLVFVRVGGTWQLTSASLRDVAHERELVLAAIHTAAVMYHMHLSMSRIVASVLVIMYEPFAYTCVRGEGSLPCRVQRQ